MEENKSYRIYLCPAVVAGLFSVALTGIAPEAQAIPLFGRQTGQNCVACHAGGQFPELTPYGRSFKLTGYTMGERTIPLAAMGVLSYNKTRNIADPGGDPYADFPNDGKPIFQTGSLFTGGRITNNLGAFVQYTYDNYDSLNANNHWVGHSHMDNVDIRLAERLVDSKKDWVIGLSLNNNPSVQDVWNSVPAWGYNVVPGSAGPAISPLISGGLAQTVAGLGAYTYWNRHLYADIALYRAADGLFSPLHHGINLDQPLKGTAPYGRIALTNEWGAHNAMVGLFGMEAKVYTDTTRTSAVHYRDLGLDGQYQYLLDPHTVTAQVSFIHEGQDQPGAADTHLDLFRAKASYIYEAKYGGSLALFDVSGSSNPAYQDTSGSVTGNMSGDPATRGWTAELFWMPWQYTRLGLQYTLYDRFNGASSDYNGARRNASDNNTLFLYLWTAY